MEAQLQRVPPITAVIGQACYACFKPESKDVALQKCTQCRSVRYCGADCQKKDWSEHKAFCKALNKLEHEAYMRSTLLFPLSDEPSSSLYDLDTIIQTMSANQIQYINNIIKRPLTTPERNLIAWEPRCMGCARTDRIMRIEAEENQLASPNTLKPCPGCGLAFYCSMSHWNTVDQNHAREPCEDGHDGLSQCHTNQEIRTDVAFAQIMAEAKAGEFHWAPERVKPAWTSLKGINWEDEFGADLAAQFRIPIAAVSSWMRAASDGLSMPMTILWALENLNVDDSWTRQEKLTIHVLGATETEIMKSSVFEEILHRLPEVRVLKLVMCGPELERITRERSTEIEMETCPNCETHGRKRIHQHFAHTYHGLASVLGDKFIKPDLAVAFNSGSSEESTQLWKDTINFLVRKNIPSVFTAYNREEAEAEASLLKQAGAKLDPVLGPVKNVWGSNLLKKEPNRVTGFYAVNGWLAGGFR